MGKPLDPDYKYEMLFTYKVLGVSQREMQAMLGIGQGTISRHINFAPSRNGYWTKEQQNQYKKQWRVSNPELNKAIIKRCNDKRYNNPIHRAALYSHNRARKAKMRDIMPDPAIKAIYLLSLNLTKATGIRYVVDHIQPLCAGGEHAAYNLQVIPYEQNASKSGKWGVEEQRYFCNGLFF